MATGQWAVYAGRGAVTVAKALHPDPVLYPCLTRGSILVYLAY